MASFCLGASPRVNAIIEVRINPVGEGMVNLLAFAASARKASYNKLLIDEAVDVAREFGANVSLYQFKDFEAPLYDAELEMDIVLPTGIRTFAKLLMSHDGLLISTPEYNHAIPGTLKNLIDWVSRAKPYPTLGKTCFLMSASPSIIGGQRGLWHTRQPLEAIGTIVYPAMFSLPEANKAFDQNGTLLDTKRHERLKDMIVEFVGFAEAVSHKKVTTTKAGD
jgi:chromate reductase